MFEMFKGDIFWSAFFITQCVWWREELYKQGLDGIHTLFYLAGIVAFIKFITTKDDAITMHLVNKEKE